ncbi:MAG: polyprenyl synthetase family protein [Hyphomicrobiales bacterium]
MKIGPAGTLSPIALLPQLDTALEWWFLQGFVETESLGRRELMAALFRHGDDEGHDDGHMLLVASLDPATGAHRSTSQVSRELVAQFLARARRSAAEAGIDGDIAAAMTAEVAANGPLRPITLVAAPARAETEPPRLDFAGFSLSASRGDMRIELDLPAGEGRLAGRLTPIAPWLDEPALGGENGVGGFAYVSCPRLVLAGTIGGEAAAGEFWFDHQFGGLGWLRSEDETGTPLGWVWFGMTLDDGRALLVTVHRDMRSGAALSAFAVLFSNEGVRLVRDVRLASRDEWISPATGIHYPLGWRIEIAELQADLAFRPTVEDQEIPVFGLMTAIWEGAGTVSGTIAGVPVAGRARLELHGFGYVFDFADWRQRTVARIDRHIAGFLPEAASEDLLERYLGPPRWAYDAASHTAMLNRPVGDLLARGGKHWRPILGLLMIDALGADVGPHEAMMSVVAELIHTASLIIDDIEDGSPLRRGGPTLHRQHGLATAINAANTLYFLPMLTVSENTALDEAQKGAIRGLLVDLMVRGHFGQAQDIHWSSLGGQARQALWDDPDLEAKILQGYAFKTGAGIRGMAEVAAIVAAAGAATGAALGRFGETFGVAFQIVDDINNFSAAPEWGKLRGEDLVSGKATFVVHRTLAGLAGAAKARFRQILDEPRRLENADTLTEAIGLVEASGALEISRQFALDLAERPGPRLTARSRRAGRR